MKLSRWSLIKFIKILELADQKKSINDDDILYLWAKKQIESHKNKLSASGMWYRSRDVASIGLDIAGGSSSRPLQQATAPLMLQLEQ